MLNIKRRCALVGLALCMTFGMTACDNKKSEEVDVSEYLKMADPSAVHKTSYETIELEVTDHTERFGDIASAKYEETVVTLDVPYGNIVPVNFIVANNHTVHKGTKVFQYTLEFEEVYMAQKRLELQRRNERFEIYRANEEERLAELLKSISQLPEGSEALAEAIVDYQEQQDAFNETLQTTQEGIDKLAEEVAAFDDNGKTFYVESPEDGICTFNYRVYWLQDQSEIFRIKKPYTNIYAVANQFQNYMVGQKVVGDYSDPNGEKHTVEGHVLSVDSVLPMNLATETAYIWFDFPEGMEETPASIHAVVEAVSLKDIILVPIDVVRKSGGANYIEILTDEGITRKNIEIFMEAGLNYVILDTSLAGSKVIVR
ncbi:MAG: hypothetical protein IKS10_01990 [Lachnospiraceae bacterium]|nr:hypothetical protein [Lachnospiraceae bacterium]